jgi:hypothetical protein
VLEGGLFIECDEQTVKPLPGANAHRQSRRSSLHETHWRTIRLSPFERAGGHSERKAPFSTRTIGSLTTVGTFSAAVRIYEQRTAAIRLGILLPTSPRRGTKFSELVADAIKFSEKHHRASKDFKQRVNLALDKFGDRGAESITTRELQDWIDEMAEGREWTGGTQNRFKSSLSAVFREGMRAGKVNGNPARLIRRSKEPLGRVRFLSHEEEAKLRKAIAATLPGRIKDQGESAFAQLDVALHTGMRKS